MLDSVCAGILAGGQSRRMAGRDKGLLQLGGRRLIDLTLARTGIGISASVICTNGDPERFRGTGAAVTLDALGDFAGPLAGIHSALMWARERGHFTHVASFAVDTPFFPTDLAAHLQRAQLDAGATTATSASNGRFHPAFSFWPIAMLPEIEAALREPRTMRLTDFVLRYEPAVATFPVDDLDPFFNINTPADLEEAHRWIARL